MPAQVKDDSSAENQYDVAAYVWPSCHDESRSREVFWSEGIGEWEIIEPYSTFREAFCIWSQPRVSNEHVAPAAPQTADTAFLVPITPDGAGVDSDIPVTGPTSQRLWDLVLTSFPFPPTSFYPAGGRTHEIAKNLVVAMMILASGSRLDSLSTSCKVASRLCSPSFS